MKAGHCVHDRRSGLADERAEPDAGEELFEEGEVFGAEFGFPFALDAAEDIDDFRVGGVAAFGQADEAGAAFVAGVRAGDVAGGFEAAEELVHGLLADAGAAGQSGGADAVGAGVLEDGDVGEGEIGVAGGIEAGDDAAVDGLGGDAEEGSDEECGGWGVRVFLRRGD